MLSRLAFIGLTLIGSSLASQQSQTTTTSLIKFHTHTLDPRHQTHVLSHHVDMKTDHHKQQYLIQLVDGQEIMQVKKEVEQYLGFPLIHYYPSNAWLTYITPMHARTIAATISGVAWIGLYESKYKLHGNIYHDNNNKKQNIEMDPFTQWFANQTDAYNDDESEYNQPLIYDDHHSINVHLQAEDPRDLHTPRDLDTETIDKIHTLIYTWMKTSSIPIIDDHQKQMFEIHSRHMITIHAKNEALLRPLAEHIATHPRVHYIERHYPAIPQNMWAKGISQFDISSPSTDKDKFNIGTLTGKDQIIAMIDTGIDHASCFFYDPALPKGPVITPYDRTVTPTATVGTHRKIASYVKYGGDEVDTVGHGTHIAGSIAGQALAEGGTMNLHNGMAPDAKLAIFDAESGGKFTIPRPLDQYLFPYATAVGAYIHNNAWGNTNPAYDSAAQEFDKYQFDNPNFLAIVAAGNAGKGATVNTGTLTSPATSKNSLVVGATTTSREAWKGQFCENGINQNPQLCTLMATITPNSVTDFSSRGPTQDGRIKPDIVAPGNYIASARNGQQIGQSCTAPLNVALRSRGGTSMSTGITSGNAAIVRQYFTDGYYPSGRPNAATKRTPSAALIKAVMIDGANPAATILNEGTPTRNDAGFGRLVLTDGMPLFSRTYTLLVKSATGDATKDSFFTSSSLNPQKFEFCATVPVATDLKVTLVWTDAPAQVNAASALINDLDLTLDSPGMTTKIGNGGATADNKNNVEQIVIPATQITKKTTFVATVTPASIRQYNAQGQQPYALVVTGNVVMGSCDPPPVTTDAPTTGGGGTTTTKPVTTNPPMTPGGEFFAWFMSEFDPPRCPVPCANSTYPNGGKQTRVVYCASSNPNTLTTDPAPCLKNEAKPVSEQTCNTNLCASAAFEWKLGTWSACTAACGGGIQTREVTCQTIAVGNMQSVPVDPTKCGDHIKPITSQPCNTPACIGGSTGVGAGGGLDGLFEWRVSAPSTCSAICDGGSAIRQVKCFIGEISVDDKYCIGLIKPTSTVPCNTQPCTGGTTGKPVTQAPATTQGPTTPGTTQGPTNSVPTVPADPTTSAPTTIIISGPIINTTVPNPDGNLPQVPSFTGNLPVPVPQSFQWQVYDYSPCSVGCADTTSIDGGIQTRMVKCRSSLGNFDDDARCAPVPKPPVSKQCNTDPCPTKDDANLEWVTGLWGMCDVDTRVQTRWLVCKDTTNRYVDFQQCQAHVGPLPATTRPCTPTANSLNEWQTTFATPVWSWYGQRFGDCSVWCNGPGTQTRGLHCLAPMGMVAVSLDQCRNDLNAGMMPSLSQSCGAGACASTPQWYGGDFISCTDPDPCLGEEHRHVFCIGIDGKKLADKSLCTDPQISFTRSPCGACIPAETKILGLSAPAVIGIAVTVSILALLGVAFLALQWRRRVRDQNNKVASRIALSKV